MRMGQAFSRALDPSRPPLFEGMGSLELLPEEAWHAACLPAAPKLARRALRDDRTAAEQAPAHAPREGTEEDEEEGGDFAEFEPYDQEESSGDGGTSLLMRFRFAANTCCMHMQRHLCCFFCSQPMH